MVVQWFAHLSSKDLVFNVRISVSDQASLMLFARMLISGVPSYRSTTIDVMIIIAENNDAASNYMLTNIEVISLLVEAIVQGENSPVHVKDPFCCKMATRKFIL